MENQSNHNRLKTDLASVRFIKATPSDSALLSKTAFQSKKIWKYSDQQMRLWNNELTITKTDIDENLAYKIYDSGTYIGFILLKVKDSVLEIQHFWLLPKDIGKGYGKYTFNFIVKRAKEMKISVIEVYAEPNAEGFYTKMGGKSDRQIESKINGRFLRVFQFEI